MEGWITQTKRILCPLTAAGLMLLAVPDLRADFLPGAAALGLDAKKSDDDRPPAPNTQTPARADCKGLLETLRQQWAAIRHDLTRSILETTLTMFFIRGGSPPPIGNTPGDTTTPPDQSGEPPPPPPPPPPPEGGGEVPPGDTGNPPPQDSPEPASLVSALLGVGLASLSASRRLRKTKTAA
jgi:hypothetical protein